MKRIISLLLLLNAASLLSSQPTISLPESLKVYAGYLGMTIDQAFEKFAAPHHLSTYRGEGDKKGSVVFSWDNSFSLFWVDDRVWQLRMDESFQAGQSLIGQSLIGQPLSQILQSWGPPQFRGEDLLIYEIPDMDYPVSCALYFSDEGSPEKDRLIDIYLFRSDY